MFEINKSKIKFMFSKILIGSGILMIAAGIAPIVWQIYRITSEPAGIGAIGGGGSLLLVFSLIVGTILILGGVVKLYKDSKTLK